jgi:tetratricopeptide (TPR) repeat protein
MRVVVQAEYARTVTLISNAPSRSVSALVQWRDRCLFWEGQCNSYIAHILLENGQYLDAQEWIRRNLDERFNPGHRKVAGDRLFELFEKSNDILGLYTVLDTLISNAMTRAIRLNWMIEKAHRQVTYEDPVGAYESLQHIYTELVKLPVKERNRWSADPRYQRVYRHIESQMKIDIRDTVIPVLLNRARADAENGGWYYAQAGQLYRCMLKYGKAEDTFQTGIRKYPDFADNYLDGGMMQYQLTRYPKADKLFTNLVNRVPDSMKICATDWRFRVLSELRTNRRPAVLDDILAWGTENRPLFASDAHYRNYTGNVYALFGEYDLATNELFRGISLQDPVLDNYLDAGYLLCIRGNSTGAGKMLDRINDLGLDTIITERLDTDWRYIELHHVSGRPYIMKE